jgi:hypothetical protein
MNVSAKIPNLQHCLDDDFFMAILPLKFKFHKNRRVPSDEYLPKKTVKNIIPIRTGEKGFKLVTEPLLPRLCVLLKKGI